MKNQYKIDVNKYFVVRRPYALFVREPGLLTKWQHVASFETTEEAREAHAKLIDLPVVL